MVNVLEALYVVTIIGALATLVALWRERRRPRDTTVRRTAPRLAGATVGLATLCVALYLYLSPR